MFEILFEYIMMMHHIMLYYIILLQDKCYDPHSHPHMLYIYVCVYTHIYIYICIYIYITESIRTSFEPKIVGLLISSTIIGLSGLICLLRSIVYAQTIQQLYTNYLQTI
jgi:hypothetical protein